LILTLAPGRRAADPNALASMVDNATIETVVEPEIDRALAAAWAANDAIAVAGSLYLAGAVYQRLDVSVS
jgi:folylpolyglutamate synthase/dihydropteroate synthase